MAHDPRQIPPAVQDALARGHIIQAIRLLRDERGLGLAEAKHLVESLAQQRPPPPAADTGEPRPFSPGGMPAGAAEALARGNKIEAIRLYRAHTRTDLRQAKEAVETYAAQHALQSNGLAPGEVARGGGKFWWIVTIVALVLLLGAWLR